MNRQEDWICRSCHHMNFQWRDSCQRCGAPRLLERGEDFHGGFRLRPANTPPSPLRMTGPDMRPGDWYCAIGNCGTHKFANRTTCFRCGAFREDDVTTDGDVFESEMNRWRGFGIGASAATNGPSRWSAGDWICTW